MLWDRSIAHSRSNRSPSGPKCRTNASFVGLGGVGCPLTAICLCGICTHERLSHVEFRGVQMSTDCGVEGLITNIRRSPTDDTRKRLFELATSNSGTYYTSYQVRPTCCLSQSVRILLRDRCRKSSGKNNSGAKESARVICRLCTTETTFQLSLLRSCRARPRFQLGTHTFF